VQILYFALAVLLKRGVFLPYTLVLFTLLFLLPCYPASLAALGNLATMIVDHGSRAIDLRMSFESAFLCETDRKAKETDWGEDP
jgi:hypothetical protein